MKKVLSIIVIILLFIVSSLIFWLGLSPATFFEFFKMYPVVGQTANQIGILRKENDYISYITSEPVLSTSGFVIIKGNTWSVEVANDDKARIAGLSNRQTLYNKRGMLFAFDDMNFNSFWMKDMLIPIDMIFFDSDWKIILIESNLQPNSFPKSFGSSIKSKYILEINALEAEIYGLKVGDKAVFLNK